MVQRGCRWRPSDRTKGSRIAGKNELHRLLRVDEDMGEASIEFFENCTQLIAELPQIPLDKNNPEDVNTKIDYDHGYDALRYGIMSRPVPRSVFDYNPEHQPKKWRPFDQSFGY